MWFFLCLPMTFPELEITTAVFHIVSPCASSRSRIEEMITMLCCFANYEKGYRVGSCSRGIFVVILSVAGAQIHLYLPVSLTSSLVQSRHTRRIRTMDAFLGYKKRKAWLEKIIFKCPILNISLFSLNSLHASWKHRIFTWDFPAASTILTAFAWIASRWAEMGADVSRTMEFWTAAT